MNKIKKFFKLSFAIGTITSLVFLPIFSFNQNKNLINNEKLATINFASKKFVVNEWNIPTPKSINVKNSSKVVSDNIELKIYLDVFKEKGNLEERIDSLLNKIKNGFKIKNIKWKVKTSKLLPIVWFYFNNVEKSKEFIEYVESLDFVKRIVFYKKVLSKNNSLHSKNHPNSKLSLWVNDYKNNNFSDVNSDLLLKQINLNFYRNIELNNLYPSSKVGILEVGSSTLSNKYKFKNSSQIKLFGPENTSEHHGTDVSIIASGKNGINQNSQIYFSNFIDNSSWQNAIEWLVLENNVRVINHSYGSTSINPINYNDESFFIDYISRKYGVVNVFAAGNGYDNPDKDSKWIDKKQLAYNAISVGSTKYRHNVNDNFEISYFSNRDLEPNHLDLPKPLVVAPGEIILQNSETILGTSYAAPVVTGAISNIFKKFRYLNNDTYRVPIAMSILASSAHLPKYKIINKKSNGFDKTYGAGLIDFEKIIEAAENIHTMSVSKNDNEAIIYTSKILALNPGQQLNIALSWMFNAGLLKENENKPELQHPSWWEWLFPTLALVKQTAQGIDYELKLKEWKNQHINENRLQLEETNSRQQHNLFSDYDLVLEKINDKGEWESVFSSQSIRSNIELIKFKTRDFGLYRYVVKKYKTTLFNNSIDDSIAVTHTITKEN